MSFYNLFTDREDSEGERPNDNGRSGRKSLEDMENITEEVIYASRDLFRKIQIMISDEATKIKDDDTDKYGRHKFMFATMFMFAVGWQIIGWLWTGVRSMFERDGKASMVWRLWKTMEGSFGTADEAEMRAHMDKLKKEFGDE